MKFEQDGSALLCFHQGERLRIEPWGQDSLRVRSTMGRDFSGNAWALTEPVDDLPTRIDIGEAGHRAEDGSMDKRPAASITNGRIRALLCLRRHHLQGEPLPEAGFPGVEGDCRRDGVQPQCEI